MLHTETTQGLGNAGSREWPGASFCLAYARSGGEELPASMFAFFNYYSHVNFTSDIISGYIDYDNFTLILGSSFSYI